MADSVPQWNGTNSKTLKAGRAIGAASSTDLIDRAAGDTRYRAAGALAIADTTGLQTALDGKAATAHSHVIADTTGLQTALDAKLASASFTFSGLGGKPTTLVGYGITDALASSYVPAWASVSGKPTTFTPEAHSHVIADTTGLQTALDARVQTVNGAAPTAGNVIVAPRVQLSDAPGASATPDSALYDQINYTGLAAGLTLNAPSGSPASGQKLLLRLKDNATARALTWNAIYRAIGQTLPTTTVLGKTTYVGLIYNATDTKWDAVAVTTET